MKIGSLFSGAGLGDLGFVMAGCEIAFQIEIDEYCQKILELRYPSAKKFRDIKTVKGSELPRCDIVSGGFPCQPFSFAGKRNGKADNRYLWPEMFRIIGEIKPPWVVAENVVGFIKIALDDVCNDLESIGYETITIVFPAHALGAWHRRQRVWIIANAKGPRTKQNIQELWRLPSRCGEKQEKLGLENENKQAMADSSSERLEEQKLFERHSFIESENHRDYWSVEPPVGRVVDGCPSRMDRLKSIGNGQVPACTKWIAENIIEIVNWI